MEAVVGQENTEIETEGYLLEKSVNETMKEFKDSVLKFFQLSQVDAAPAEAAAAGGEKAATPAS